MKSEEKFVLVIGIFLCLFVAVKFFFNIRYELSLECWERAFWAIVIFSGTSAASLYGLFLLFISSRKNKRVR